MEEYLRLGCALETRISSASEGGLNGRTCYSVYACATSALSHCLAGPLNLLFVLLASASALHTSNPNPVLTLFTRLNRCPYLICAFFIFTFPHIHTPAVPDGGLLFPVFVCAHIIQQWLVFSVTTSIPAFLLALSHFFKLSFSFFISKLAPCAPLTYSFPFTVPSSSSIFFTWVVSVAIIVSI